MSKICLCAPIFFPFMFLSSHVVYMKFNNLGVWEMNRRRLFLRHAASEFGRRRFCGNTEVLIFQFPASAKRETVCCMGFGGSFFLLQISTNQLTNYKIWRPQIFWVPVGCPPCPRAFFLKFPIYIIQQMLASKSFSI